MNTASLSRLLVGTIPCAGCGQALRQVRDSDDESYWLAVMSGSSSCPARGASHRPNL